MPIASSIFDFIFDVASDPMPYLDSWRYVDETRTQHYVETVEFVD